MANNFQASFVLHLQDDVTAGMQRIIAMTKRFAEMAKTLGFKGLEGADATVRTLGRDIGTVNTQLGATARQAEAAAVAIKRMSGAELAQARAQGEAAQRMRALATAAPGGLGQMYGPGGVPLFAGGPRFVPAAAGTTSPVGGTGWRARASAGLARAGAGFGGANERIGLMGGAMAGISLEAPIIAAANLDKTLRLTSIIEGKSGAASEAEVARLRERLTDDSLRTGQSLQGLAEAHQSLVNRGLDVGTVDKLMPIHGRAATAYGVDSESMGNAVFAMNRSMHIGQQDMEGALAAMAQATHEGSFNMTSMSHYLPNIFGRMDTMGLHGRANADKAMAALEIVSRNSADPSQTATDFTDMMIALTQKYTRHAFAKEGVDLPKMLLNAEKQGIDPMEAYIGTLDRMTRGLPTDLAKALKLGGVMHNQQAGSAALALLKFKDEYKKLRDELGGVGADKLGRDYDTAMAGLEPKIMMRTAKLKALEMQLGMGFAWTVPASSYLLGGVVAGLGWMDTHLPGLSHLAFQLAGGMLGLVAAMGVLGVVAGPVKAGAALLRLGGLFKWLGNTVLALGRFAMANPLVAIAALGATAALYLWAHWDRFAQDWGRIWAGIGRMAKGDIWGGAKAAMEATWGKDGFAEKLFGAFGSWVDGWSGGFATDLGGWIRTALDSVVGVINTSLDGWKKLFKDIQIPAPAGQAEQRRLNGQPADGSGDTGLPGADEAIGAGLRHPTAYRLRGPGAAPQGAHRFDGTIRVEVDGAARVSTRSSSGLRLLAPDRGPMLART